VAKVEATMANETVSKSNLAVGLLLLFPPTIRASVLEDETFRHAFDLSVDAVIRLEQSGISFDRSRLFGAIRQLMGPERSNVEVTSKDKQLWKLVFAENKEIVLLVRDEVKIPLPNFSCLSPESAKRLAWFDGEAKKFELNDDRSKKWREILEMRPVDDDEVDQLLTEIRFTPLYVSSSITSHLRGETLNILSLVPSDIRYYDRLVGAFTNQLDLRDFGTATAIAKMREWVQHSPFEGLKRCFLMSSHPSLVQSIPLNEAPRDEVLRFYQWLEERGDRISQLGGIECALANLEKFPELEPVILKLVEGFLKDNPDDEQSRPSLLCGLIVLVEGELARTGIARGRPPYWRRLAAIAHASVLERAIVAAGIPSSDMRAWAMSSRALFFYLQAFIDLRTEPRWLPDFVLPDQLKAECIGRLVVAVHGNADKVQSPELKKVLTGEGEDELQSQLNLPFALLPGPLEGGGEAILEMPAETEAELRRELEAEELTPKSFARLVNSSLIYHIGPQLAQLAAKALRRAKYQVRHVRASNEAFSLLSGLATVAAVTRTHELAEEVRILARVVRRGPGIDIETENALRIALIAAAAYNDRGRWCQFVGDWLIELAYEEMPRETAVMIHRNIRLLCQLESQLWATSARAEAAVTALLESAAA
jgi:hypothetical protein